MSGWSALGTGLGSLADGLITRKVEKERMKWDMYKFNNQIAARVADAKRSGIHPLAALGMSPYSGGPGSGPSTNFAAAGQDIGKAIDNATDRVGRQVRDIQLQKENESLKQMKINTDILASERNRLKNLPVTPTTNEQDYITGLHGQNDAVSKSGYRLKPNEITISDSTGVTSGVSPMQQKMVNKEGTVYFIDDEKLSDPMENDVVMWTKWNIGKLVKEGSNFYRAFMGSKQNRTQFANEMRKQRNRVLGKPAKGHEWRWDILRNSYVHAKKKGSSRFFVQKWWINQDLSKIPN